MKQSFFKTTLLSAAMVCAAFTMSAADKPTFWVPDGKGTPLWTGMSDNGEWGVADIAPSEDGSTNPVAAIIYDIKKKTSVTIKPTQLWCSVFDVTDDGKKIVGNNDGSPSYYDVDAKKWVKLPSLMKSWTGGTVLCVTPDGKYAVGYSQPEYNEWGQFYATMWDLEKQEVIQLGENAPYLDTDGQDPEAAKISSVSPDGRYLVFEISWYQNGGWSALYDRIEDKVYPLGMKMNANGTLSRDDSGFVGATEPHMSNNGKWLTGGTMTMQDMGDYDNTKEYAFLYDVEKKEMRVITGDANSDVLATAVLDDGTILACQPMMNPAREMLVLHGNYFYPMSEVYSQSYHVNPEMETNGVAIVTGTPLYVSSNGRTWYNMATANYHDGYLVTFPESISDACDRVNLLSNYRVSPASGSTFSELSIVNITFDRAIGLQGAARHIKLKDEEGKEIATAQNVNIMANTRLSFSFRPTMLEAGKKYTITLPAGFITMDGDASMEAPEIKIEYIGRRDGKIELTKVTPPDNTVLAEFSGSSPISLTFDTQVAVNEANYGHIYRKGSAEPLTDVLLTASGNRVTATPAIAQHLFKGYDYTIEIPANSVTDLSGQGGCDAITLHYEGSYVQEASSDSKYIWHEQFDQGYRGLYYEGDHNDPADVPFNWGFDKDTTPWYLLRSSESTEDWCLGSHSMYMNQGKSDDWFTSTQLYIPDESCFLRFEGQSYLKSKEDHLKVYVLVTDAIYQYADKEYIDRFKKEGILLADLILNPGQSQEGLEGDWEEYTFDLKQFAQKYIYIGFCNDNENQSAVFVDNIAVERDLSFFTSFTHETYLENAESVLIEPVVTINSALSEFVAFDAVLLDSENKQVDSFNLKNQSLKEGDVVMVKFTKPLSLKKGIVNNYTLQINLNSKNGEVETGNIIGEIYNMIFTPKKHIVIEEYSGRECANCPLGIAAMNNLEKIYGDAILPIVLRCYNGDPAGNTVQGYNSFLGMTAAPSGRLNRGPISMPMVSVNGDYRFTGREYDNDVWYDVAQDEMKVVPLMEVKGKAMYNDEKEAIAEFEVRPAIDLKGQSIGVFVALVEDHVTLAQQNNFYNTKDDDLLPWSAGGEFAKNLVVTEFNDIARAAYGDTYFGSLGQIPAELKGGETYKAKVVGILPPVEDMNIENCRMVLMAINTATGKVIDACSAHMEWTDKNSVNEIGSVKATIKVENGRIVIYGIEGEFVAEAYTLDGSVAASVRAENTVSLDVPSGLIIVRVKTTEGNLVRKFIVR